LFIAGKLIGSMFLHVIGENPEWAGDNVNKILSGVRNASWFDPHALLYIILPPLLYESACSMSWHVLRKVLPSALLLAVPGVMLNTGFTSLFVWRAFTVNGERPSYASSVLLSSILSATDPVAVVSALAALGAPQKLSTIVEGESLLNDGSAVVLTYVAMDWVKGLDAPPSEKQCAGSPPQFGCVCAYFIKVALGGASLGVLAGIILYYWIVLARTRHMVKLELSIVLTLVYGVFYSAEAVGTSGVLAVVALGIFMSANVMTKLSHEGRHAHHVVLEQISYACNQVTFFAAGIITARFMWSETSCDHDFTQPTAWLELAGLYVVIHITRAAVIAIFWPLLRKIGYGLTVKEGIILVFGGLRGAVGLIMGLIVEHNSYIDPYVKSMIAFHTSGIVLLTLLINGSTIDEVYRKLNLYEVNQYHRHHLTKVLEKLETDCRKHGLFKLQEDWYFHDVMFSKLLRCLPNFAHVGFNHACQPYPQYIEHVSTTLKALEADAQQFKKDRLIKDKTKGEGFEARWSRHALDSRLALKELLKESGAIDRRDQLLNVTFESSLEFNPTEPGVGFYVSSRNLKLIMEQEGEPEEMFSFTIRIMKLAGVRVIVGFVADVGKVRDMTSAMEDGVCRTQILGTEERSIGLDCTDGRLARCVTLDSVTTPLPQVPVAFNVNGGDAITVEVHKHPMREWEVVFKASKENRVIGEQSCGLSGFQPEELFPVLEFRPADELLHPKSKPSVINDLSGSGVTLHSAMTNMSLSAVTTAGGSLTSVGQSIIRASLKGGGQAIDAVQSGVQWGANAMAMGDVLPKIPGIKRASAPDTAEAAQSPASEFLDLTGDGDTGENDANANADCDSLLDMPRTNSEDAVGNTVNGSNVPNGTLQIGEADAQRNGASSKADVPGMLVSQTQSDSSPAIRSNGQTSTLGGTGKVKMFAKVALSFEPQLASDSESVNEIFHVLFNTVRNMYKSAHDHGILSELPLFWLDAAVSDAMDSADQEVGCLRAVDLMNSGTQSSSLASTGVKVLRPAKTIAALRSLGIAGGDDANTLSLMEPLVVEYKMVQRRVAKASIWDQTNFRFLRQYGFHRTKAKVEALWAFIEAHETVMRESPSLSRFPSIVRCLETIISLAKKDLQILEDIQPRKSFYAKHGLALRMLLNKRQDRLKGKIKAGWITEADGEELHEALWERILQSDNFFPSKGRWRRFGLCCSRRNDRDPAQPSLSKSHSQSASFAFNARDEVEL
jgi:NhaP-type Na+/H+ or K+/H+ antiporter